MSFDVGPYELPLVSPMVTSYRSIESRRGVLVSLAEGGLTGWGDACPMVGWSRSSLDEVTNQLTVAAARFGS